MNLSLFIAQKIIRNKQPSFSGFIIKLATAATAISVATMIVTLSMVNGFQDEVEEKVFSFWGHLRIQNLEPMRSMVAEETPMTRTPEMEHLIATQQGISHVHAFAAKSVVLRSKEQFEGVLIKGVDRRFSKSPFERFLREGRNITFPDSGYSSEVLISTTLAERLGIKTGDTVSSFYLRQGEDVRARKLIVCGLFKTGIEEYDNNFVIADLRFLQKLNFWQPNQIGGYEIWLNEKDDAASFSQQLSKALPQGVVSSSIKSVYPNIFDWLNIQNQTKQIVIGVMLAVAIINLITCLLILVMERTKMVALLSAMGMPAANVGGVFWYYASWIAGVGVSIGLLLGLGLLGIQQATGIIKMDEATYYVSEMPVKIIWWQVSAVALGTMIICIAALRIPLSYLRSISLIKALRFS